MLQDDLNEEEAHEDDDDDEVDRKSQQIAVPEYKRLIAIHAGKGKGGLDDWLRLDPNKVRRLSFSELELEKAAVTHANEIIRYYVDHVTLSTTYNQCILRAVAFA